MLPSEHAVWWACARCWTVRRLPAATHQTCTPPLRSQAPQTRNLSPCGAPHTHTHLVQALHQVERQPQARGLVVGLLCAVSDRACHVRHHLPQLRQCERLAHGVADLAKHEDLCGWLVGWLRVWRWRWRGRRVGVAAAPRANASRRARARRHTTHACGCVRVTRSTPRTPCAPSTSSSSGHSRPSA
jgi:hypothetical protein